MSSRRPSSSRQPQRVRGPSRPVDPRRAPGLPPRRGTDTFAIALVGISSALAVLVVFLFLNRGSTTPQPPSGTGVQPGQTVISVDPVAGGTATAIAFATATGVLPSISAQEALALHQTGSAKFIDVRIAASYNQQHIKGAVNVPQAETFNRPKEFPKEGNIILYCQ